jgi:glutamate-1-semialdehyde aminotransferase
MDAAQNTFISSTNWTERVGSVAALAMIKKHREVDAGAHLMKIGKLVQEGWQFFAEKNRLPLSIGGIPPLSHFSFLGEEPLVMKSFFIQLMLEKGFLALTLFYAMYAHTENHVNSYLKAVDEVFGEISEACQKGNIEKKLKGKPANTGFKRLT